MSKNTDRGARKSPLNHSPDALRYALKQSGFTQKAFAEKVEISEGLLSEMLKGTRNVKQELLRKMASELNCPVVVLEAKIPA